MSVEPETVCALAACPDAKTRTKTSVAKSARQMPADFSLSKRMMNLGGCKGKKHRGNGVAVTEWQAHGNLRTILCLPCQNGEERARMTLTVLTDPKSIKAARKRAIFFQDESKTVRINPSFHQPDGDF